MILNNLQGKVFCGGKEVSQIYHGTTPLWTGTVNVQDTTKINIWFDNSGSMDTTLDDLVRMQSTNLKTTLLPFYNNDEEKYNSLVTVRNFSNIHGGIENSVYLGGADMQVGAASDPPFNVINITFCDEESSPGTDFAVAAANLKTGLEANIGNAAIFNRVVNSGFGSLMSGRYRSKLVTLRNGGGVFATQCDYNLDVVPNNGETYYAGLIEASLLRLGLEKA